MDFLEIIDEKLNRAEEEFIANSDNNLNNCKQLLDYIYALKNIQSLYRTVASDGDTSIIVDAINNGVSSIRSGIDGTIKGIGTLDSKLATVTSQLSRLSRIETQCDEIIKKLKETYAIIRDNNDKMVDANNYLKIISEK